MFPIVSVKSLSFADVSFSGSSFCVTKELEAFETAVGQTLSLDTIAALILNPPTSLSSNVTCTNCVKEAYNIIKKDIPSAASLVDESSITEECGASFVGEFSTQETCFL